VTKNRVAGHYARAGQGKNKRVLRPPTPTSAPPVNPAPETPTAQTPTARIAPTSSLSPDVNRQKPAAAVSSPAPRSTLSRLNLRPTPTAPVVNYDYVYQDLKRIGILSAFAVVILGALTVTIG
jgi:hypothetical protein